MVDRMGSLMGVVVQPEPPRRRFDLEAVYRMRLALVAMILRFWYRGGAEFVTLVEVAGVLLLRPVHACGRVGCHTPRLPPIGRATGLLCEVHERETMSACDLPEPAVFVQRATWPILSTEARRLFVMTLACGAQYQEAPDPIGTGPGFEERLSKLRAEFGEVESAVEMVT